MNVFVKLLICCEIRAFVNGGANVKKPRAAGYVATKLMCRLICNLPELNIRIFQSACLLLLIYRYVFWIADPDIRYSRIAYPAEH
mgnify:FL=1